MRGPAPGVLIVLAVLGLMGEGQGPESNSKPYAERMAAYEARTAAERAAFDKLPAIVEMRRRQAEQAAAERARRVAAARNGEELYTPDPYRMDDCRRFAAVMAGQYSPEFERAMQEKFFPALTNGERAAWRWDRFKRWAADLAGRPGFACDTRPQGYNSDNADSYTPEERAAADLYRQAWEERGRRGQRVRVGEIQPVTQEEIRREIRRQRADYERRNPRVEPNAATRKLLEDAARNAGEVK